MEKEIGLEMEKAGGLGKEEALSKPSYTSRYDGQIKDLYDKIVKRPGFSYEAGADPLYASYKEQYRSMGREAMEHSMGKAASLTGGYGNSYAQRVGQEEYDRYLGRLDEVLPELYSQAYQRYKDDGDRLEDEYRRLQGLEQKDYQQYRDEVADWHKGQEQQAEKDKQDFAIQKEKYERLKELIQYSGYVPSKEELEEGGMSKAQADAYLDSFKSRHSSSRGGATYYYGSNGKLSGNKYSKPNRKQWANGGSAGDKLYGSGIKGRK